MYCWDGYVYFLLVLTLANVLQLLRIFKTYNLKLLYFLKVAKSTRANSYNVDILSCVAMLVLIGSMIT